MAKSGRRMSCAALWCSNTGISSSAKYFRFPNDNSVMSPQLNEPAAAPKSSSVRSGGARRVIASLRVAQVRWHVGCKLSVQPTATANRVAGGAHIHFPFFFLSFRDHRLNFCKQQLGETLGSSRRADKPTKLLPRSNAARER
nr:uncharacterized protein LOC129382327 [Dermacentor andersoni]